VSEVDSDKAPQQPKGNDSVAAQNSVKKDSQKDSKEAPKAPPPKTSSAAKPDARSGGKGLAGLALLVGLAGLAAGGYSVWQTQQIADQEQQQQQSAQATSEQTRQLGERSQQLASRLGKLEQPNSWRIVAVCFPSCKVISSGWRGVSNRFSGLAASNGGLPRPSICCAWRCCVCRRCRT